MSAAVNKPTVPKVKEADLNRKLQLFGIYSAFQKGKAPSNKQIDVAMNSALASRPLASPSKRLSSEGQVLVADLRDVIEKAKVMLLTKNEGNLIQDFIWQTQSVGSGQAGKPGAPVSKDEAKQHGQEALEGLKTLGTLLITNGQFRKLLNDAMVLLRDVAGDGAQKAADRVNPNEEQLSQIDQPADDNTWHDTPDFKGMKEKAKTQYEANKPVLKKSAKSAADDAQAADTNTGAAENAKQNVASQLSEEDKQKAREKKEKAIQDAKDYLNQKMPKERREQTIWRLKKMVVEVQGHQDYQRAIDTLLRLAETYHGHGKAVGSESAGAVKGAHSGNDGLNNAEADLKILIERFANSTSTDDLFDSINQIYRDADQDPELKNWFKSLDTYIRKCLKEQGYVMQDAATEEGKQLYDQGNFLLRERYKNHTNRVIEEFKFLGKQFDQDPANKAFGDAVNKLFKDLGNDTETGKPAFKPHLLKDLSNVILPAFFENIHYIPIPRIEYSDPTADAVIENLVIEGDNLAPNVFEFGSDNYFRWGRKKIANKNKNKVMVSVSGIQMDLKDVSYYIKKKQGFPGITDVGVMDIFLGGSGFSFKLAMETAEPSDRAHFFKVNNVTVDIKHMSIKLKESKYKLLFSLVRPLLMKVMNPILQKVIAKQITDQVSNLDAYCYEIHQTAKKAEADAKRNPDPENVKNIYQRHWEAYQQKVAEGKKKKEEAKAKAEEKKGQTNIAMTQHESMFPDIKLPGGVSTKATEYRDLADKGDKWESPVFSIGSAGESRSLPKVEPVTRKPHSTTPAELKTPGQSSTTGATGGPAGGLTMGQSSGANAAGYGAGQGTSATLAQDLLPNGNTTKTETTGNTTLGANNPVLSGNV